MQADVKIEKISIFAKFLRMTPSLYKLFTNLYKG